jgi:hypothetical protein
MFGEAEARCRNSSMEIDRDCSAVLECVSCVPAEYSLSSGARNLAVSAHVVRDMVIIANLFKQDGIEDAFGGLT